MRIINIILLSFCFVLSIVGQESEAGDIGTSDLATISTETKETGTKESETKYIVYYFLGEDCKICQYYAPLMNDLHEDFASDSLSFVGLFPNRYSSEEGISNYREKYSIAFEVKREYFGTKTKEFGVMITPEVVVYDSESKEMIYKGRIDNSYFRVGKQRKVVTTSELADVLTSLQNGTEVTTEDVPPIGCFITFR